MKTSDLNVNNTESDHATAIFRRFQDAIFSREHTSVKTLTKIIFDLLQWQEIATSSLLKKELPSLLSPQQHFAGIFASEPMTLPEIDYVSFLVEHAQTFFAGEVWEPATWYCAYMLWRIDSCLNRVSTDQYHMTRSWAQLSTHRGYAFFLIFPLTSY